MNATTTVLVINESALIHHVVSETLIECGYIVMHASTLQVAVATIERTRPDLILLGKVRRCPDGVQILKTLKEYESTREIPVIYITSWEAHVDEALRAGAADYLMTSMSAICLRKRVEVTLRSSRLEKQRCRHCSSSIAEGMLVSEV